MRRFLSCDFATYKAYFLPSGSVFGIGTLLDHASDWILEQVPAYFVPKIVIMYLLSVKNGSSLLYRYVLKRVLNLKAPSISGLQLKNPFKRSKASDGEPSKETLCDEVQSQTKEKDIETTIVSREESTIVYADVSTTTRTEATLAISSVEEKVTEVTMVGSHIECSVQREDKVTPIQEEALETKQDEVEKPQLLKTKQSTLVNIAVTPEVIVNTLEASAEENAALVA